MLHTLPDSPMIAYRQSSRLFPVPGMIMVCWFVQHDQRVQGSAATGASACPVHHDRHIPVALGTDAL